MTELFVDKNAVVTLDFSMKDSEGTLIDSSRDGGDPLVYLHGHGQIPPALERDLAGRKVGEKVLCTLTPADGFGERDDKLRLEVPKEQFADVPDLQEGMPFHISAEGDIDQDMVFRVTDISEDIVVLDANHPLAGLTTIWDCTVNGIRMATDEEISHGHVHGPGGHHHHAHDDEDEGCGDGCTCH